MSGDGQPSDTMRERAGENTLKVWLLLDADRRVVAVLLSVVFAALVLAGAAVSPGITEGDPVETLYQALVAATVTAVTLVLTLSQLVLSQELGAVGDQRERMQGAIDFRADAADAVGMDVPPADPAAFLRALVETTRERAVALDEAVPEGALGEADGRFRAYLDSIVGNAEAVAEQLDGASFGTFAVVGAALNYNYSWKLYAGRRLRATHGASLPDAAADHLDGLVRTLELFGPAREHVKTLYFQWELSNLSRTLLVVSVPALSVAVGSLLFLDPGTIRGSTAGFGHATLLVALTTTLSLAPFMILLAYVLRIVTVTQRTLSIGPFILRDTDRSVRFEQE